MNTLQGRRVHFEPGDDAGHFEEGDYGLLGNCWMGSAPGGLLTNLAGHKITEHEDGTITASPSIDVKRGDGEHWHGWLERGVWRWQDPERVVVTELEAPP